MIVAQWADVFTRSFQDLWFISGNFIGELIRWFIIIVFLMASLEVLGLTQVNIVLQSVVLVYLPQIIAAVIILILAAVGAELAKNVVVASARAAGTHAVYFMGALTKWVIWILAFLVALSQIGIAAEFAQMLFMGVVIGLSIAFGLAFGLGGKDAAASYIDKLRKEMSGH